MTKIITKQIDLDDLFVLSEILDIMDLTTNVEEVIKGINQEEINNMNQAKSAGKQMAVSVFADLAVKVLKKIHLAKSEVYQLISNLTEKPVDEVRKLGLKDLKAFFGELFSNEDVADFLSSGDNEPK